LTVSLHWLYETYDALFEITVGLYCSVAQLCYSRLTGTSLSKFLSDASKVLKY